MSSAAGPSSPGPVTATAKKTPKNLYFLGKSILLAEDRPDSPIIAAHSVFGEGLSKLSATLVVNRTTPPNASKGFRLGFPLAKGQVANENAGYGVRYTRRLDYFFNEPSPLIIAIADRSNEGRLVQAKSYELDFKFPRGQSFVTVEQPTPDIAECFPATPKLCMVLVRLTGDAQVTVTGFGMPYFFFSSSPSSSSSSSPSSSSSSFLPLLKSF
jgi:hypothetical protein